MTTVLVGLVLVISLLAVGVLRVGGLWLLCALALQALPQLGDKR